MQHTSATAEIRRPRMTRFMGMGGNLISRQRLIRRKWVHLQTISCVPLVNISPSMVHTLRTSNYRSILVNIYKEIKSKFYHFSHNHHSQHTHNNCHHTLTNPNHLGVRLHRGRACRLPTAYTGADRLARGTCTRSRSGV